MKKVLAEMPGNIHFIPIDFDEQDLNEGMNGSSFEATQPAIFVWEAVTQYITAEAVAQTLRFIGNNARGSRVVFTYVLRWIIEHPERDPEAMALMILSKMKMAPFIFGLEPDGMHAYLKEFHLRVIEDVGAEYFQKMWLESMGRKLDVTIGERFCLAEAE